MNSPDVEAKARREEILDLIKEKGALLVREQAKALLESKINPLQEELSYLKDRIGKENKKLDKTRRAVQEIEPGVIKTARMLSEYKRERDALVEESEKLKDAEEKMAILSERRAMVGSKGQTVRRLQKERDQLYKECQDSLNSRGKTEKKFMLEETKHKDLTEAIRALTEEKERCLSVMPEDRNREALKKEKDRARKDIESYTGEVNKYKRQLNKMNKKAALLRKQAEEKTSERERFFAQRDERQADLDKFEALGMENQEALMEEVAALKEHKQDLAGVMESASSEIKRLETAIIKIEPMLERERNSAVAASEKLHELEEKKPEIDNAEMTIEAIQLDIAAHERMKEVVDVITERLTPLNKDLSATLKDYNNILDELRKTIQK